MIVNLFLKIGFNVSRVEKQLDLRLQNLWVAYWSHSGLVQASFKGPQSRAIIKKTKSKYFIWLMIVPEWQAISMAISELTGTCDKNQLEVKHFSKWACTVNDQMRSQLMVPMDPISIIGVLHTFELASDKYWSSRRRCNVTSAFLCAKTSNADLTARTCLRTDSLHKWVEVRLLIKYVQAAISLPGTYTTKNTIAEARKETFASQCWNIFPRHKISMLVEWRSVLPTSVRKTRDEGYVCKRLNFHYVHYKA